MTAISLVVESQNYAAKIKFQGDIPHISDYSGVSSQPHFNCEIKQLMNFVKPQEEDQETHKLTVRVKRKLLPGI